MYRWAINPHHAATAWLEREQDATNPTSCATWPAYVLPVKNSNIKKSQKRNKKGVEQKVCVRSSVPFAACVSSYFPGRDGLDLF
jgi:hypothetical protein